MFMGFEAKPGQITRSSIGSSFSRSEKSSEKSAVLGRIPCFFMAQTQFFMAKPCETHSGWSNAEPMTQQKGASCGASISQGDRAWGGTSNMAGKSPN
jgi:hypothetical protein